jgi:hypothetical protein
MHPTEVLLNPNGLMLFLKSAHGVRVQSLTGVENLKPNRLLLIFLFLSTVLASPRGWAQQPLVFDPLPESNRDIASFGPQFSAIEQDPTPAKADPDAKGNSSQDGGSKIDSPQPKTEQNQDQSGGQTKRILWIIPNFRSVSADTYLPPQTFKEKFWLATQDSFDYSAFIYEGIVSGIAMAQKAEPSFGQGAAGYGIYYGHTFADGTIENYFVEAIVPAVTKEDPRYYTLGHGGFFKRTAYSLSRLVITRNDAGHNTFNISEIAGAGAAAGISNLYYPPQNTWVKTYQRWGSQILQDGLGFIFKEFWPDVNRAVFHNKF